MPSTFPDLSPAPRRGAVTAALLAIAVLASLLVVPAPAVAESACVDDPRGDVVDRRDDTITDLPVADIVATCTELTPDTLEISVRVVSPSDPSNDPAWDDFASAIGAAIDVGGAEGEEFDVNFARFADGVAVRVYPHAQPDPVCSGEGIYDGTRYRMVIPTDCIGSPSQVSTAAFLFYGSSVTTQDQSGFYDEVPPAPTFLGPYSTAADPVTAVQRLAGPARVDTAIRISQDDFADGAAQAVVLARSDEFPDALAAAPLATMVGGPLLLTPSTAVARITADEIRRVLPAGGTVYLAGGTAALSADVQTQLEDLGYAVVRVDGPTRYATAVEIAGTAVEEPNLIVVANGNDFPDALIGGALAAAEGGVQILTDGPQLDSVGAAYLQAHPDAEVLAIGAVAAQAIPGAAAIAGADPFATSVAVAQQRYGATEGFALASGTNFPDALAGGAHAGRRGIPLLLSWPDVLPETLSSYLTTSGPRAAYVYGGEDALSYQVEADAAAALN